jgi:hypothetical protein
MLCELLCRVSSVAAAAVVRIAYYSYLGVGAPLVSICSNSYTTDIRSCALYTICAATSFQYLVTDPKGQMGS